MTLGDWLRAHDVTDLDVCGIATDYCVRATALDAVRQGFEARLLAGFVVGVSPASTAAALDEMRNGGVVVVG